MNPLRRFARDFADALFPPQRFVVCDPALARLSDALAVRSDFAAVGRALGSALEQYEHDRETLRELGEEAG